MSVKDWCHEYIHLNERLKDLQKELKKVKIDKYELEDKIQSYLEEQKKEGLVYNDHIFRNKKTTKHKAMSKGDKDKSILHVLQKHLPEDDILSVYDEMKEALAKREEEEINKIVISQR